MVETVTGQQRAQRRAVEVSLHATLNTTKDVVVGRELLNSTEEQIATKLAPQEAITLSLIHI